LSLLEAAQTGQAVHLQHQVAVRHA
jgi:hypothetical protein